MAATTEAEIDSGRWTKEVLVEGARQMITIALPDLLNPPSFKDLLDRGFEPDRRAMEQAFTQIDRYFAEHPAASLDEMNAVMSRQFTGNLDEMPQVAPRTPLEQAQDLCYQAFDCPGRRAVQLARQALTICPDCADAYVILAEYSHTSEKSLDLYAQGVAAGARSLGQKIFEEEAGHFYGMVSTRPYMRARCGLAHLLARQGRLDEAVDHFQEMLRLNPDDNQGVRYTLMPLLLRRNRDVEAARLLKAFDEPTAVWRYAKALLAFRLSGRSATACAELREAIRQNPHVVEWLLSDEEIPQPSSYALGSPEEAAVCAEELRPAFQASPGALDWLKAEHSAHARSRPAELRKRRQRELDKKRKNKKRKK